jgi:hypothetical protein
VTIFTLQSNLNRGELDPKLLGRSDLEAYYAGCQQASNVLCLPQGGVVRRPGTVYKGTLPSSGRMENFSFNNEQQYLLVFTNLRMYIYKAGVLQTNIAGSGNDYLTTTITTAMLSSFDYTQSADTVIISHPDLQPHTITRTSDTAWAWAAITFSSIPQYDYNDASSPTPTSEVQSLVFANASAGDRYKLTVDDFLTDDLVYSTNTTENATRIKDALHGLANTAKTGITVAHSAGTTYTITFGGDSAGPYGLTTATPILTELVTFEGESTRTTPGVSQAEDSWSAGRGWPVSSTFHAGRLWFGGSKSRPAAIWGSVIGDFFNFEAGKYRDDDLIEFVLDTDQLNAVKHIVSNRKLQVFTTGQLFYCPEDVITPSNVSFRSVNNEGVGAAAPAILDEDVLYGNRTGKRLNRFSLVNEYQPTAVQNLSVLASHLINSPVQIVSSRGTSSTDANYIYIVNSDGTMTVLNTLKTEGVEGFTTWDTTGGTIKSAAVVDDTLYLLILRGSSYLLEQADADVFYDSAVEGSSTDTLDMSHILGVTIGAKGDGYDLGSEFTAAASTDFGDSRTALQAGIEFAPTVQTMPVNVTLGDGPSISKKKRIRRAFVRVEDTAGITIGGENVPDRTMDGTAFSAPATSTGQKLVKQRGYSRDADITITQFGPFPMTLLSIMIEVSI